MIKWYEGLHPWNRIALTGALAIFAATATFGDVSVERMVATPVVATGMWACGWATINALHLVRRVSLFAR